jgi:SAM-dependent methyltransferase
MQLRVGMGGVVVAFCEAGAEVYGVEVEKELFEITQETLNAFKFEADIKLYDGYNFPFQNNLFDFAHSASVLEHTDDPEVYLGQILNALKPEGRLYLAFPNKLWPKETHTGLYFLGILPTFLQNLYIKIFNRNPLKDNNLHFYSYFNLLKILSNVNKSAASLGYKLVITEEKGNTQSGVKKAIKNVLNLLGISYKAFLPHVSVILKKVKV